MSKIELLSPVGNLSKLHTALHFGADAVYLSGKSFGLRAFSDNFDEQELKQAIEIAHLLGKKVYVTVNIFAHNKDFIELKDYLLYLEMIKVDGVIVSDIGVVSFIKAVAPKLNIHLSTQANTTNKYAVKFWADYGISRVVLARELSLNDIKEIKDYVGNSIELEAFVHGAMCISYSGRCLLSNYLAGRDGNKGECVQSCRWEYQIAENLRHNNPLTIQEDNRGTYILNSKDLCTIDILDKIIDAGITSLKIEGRMKSEYYVGSVTNAYRLALDNLKSENSIPKHLVNELYKVSHRDYTRGFYLGNEAEVCLESSMPKATYEFIAEVKSYDDQSKKLKIEQRNRFNKGDVLEILSNNPDFNNKTINIDLFYDEDGNIVEDAKLVQQVLYLETDYRLSQYDMLRRRKDER